MSDTYNDQFLENRYEAYIEAGYSPKDAEIMAREDFDNGNWEEPLNYEEEEDDE